MGYLVYDASVQKASPAELEVGGEFDDASETPVDLSDVLTYTPQNFASHFVPRILSTHHQIAFGYPHPFHHIRPHPSHTNRTPADKPDATIQSSPAAFILAALLEILNNAPDQIRLSLPCSGRPLKQSRFGIDLKITDRVVGVVVENF